MTCVSCGSMATAAALALVVPLIVWNGAPYVEEGGARYLVDTGASVSCARAARGPLSETAAGVLGGASRAAGMSMPAGVDGILGWDWIRHSAQQRVEFDLREPGRAWLRLDEGDAGGYTQAGGFGTRALGGGQLPCLVLELFGVSRCTALGVVDTGSPLTIVSPAASESAALFDEQQLSDSALPPLYTMGVDGLQTELLPKRAAGLRLGGAGAGWIEVADRKVFSAQLPMMAAAGPTDTPLALVGLDVLGNRFALDLERGVLEM